MSAEIIQQIPIVHYANTRGADRILYAGYYPQGLSLERIFRELPEVPFRDEAVWRKFLSDNARRVFKLPFPQTPHRQSETSHE